jgi:DNA-binding NarL/FixJ family response regulator
MKALTARENEVAVLIARGRLNKEIAHELGIALKTVEAHRYNLRAKLGARNTAGIAHYVHAGGLFSEEPSWGMQ